MGFWDALGGSGALWDALGRSGTPWDVLGVTLVRSLAWGLEIPKPGCEHVTSVRSLAWELEGRTRDICSQLWLEDALGRFGTLWDALGRPGTFWE